MAADEQTQQQRSLVEFISTFETVSEHISEISDLGDGVALFEALSEIAPEYFDPTTIARHLGDNWALKSSNLRKLIRNLENYYHNELSKDADFASININMVAKEANMEMITTLVELVAGAAVTCSGRSVYVQRIMTMSPELQLSMKSMIERSMKRMTDYEMEHDDDVDDDEDTELLFNDVNDNTKIGDDDDDGDQANRQLFPGNANTALLEEKLEDARRELAACKDEAAEAAEESQKAQKKLQALVEDLQDRLMKRQDELINVEEDLQRTTSELEETKSKLAELEQQKATLEDDLDVAKAKAQQLYKAEATVVAYKKKLEAVGVRNQQVDNLEGQAEKYLKQIMELEAEVKKSKALEKTINEMKEKIDKLQKEKDEYENNNKTITTELNDIKSRLQASENAKKSYEDELIELRGKMEAMSDANGINIDNVVPTEQMKKLELENKKLKEQIAQLNNNNKSTTTTTTTTTDDATLLAIAVPADDDTPEMTKLKIELQRINTALKQKEQENVKISSDKDKLEAYTKRTLAKFQDKYLVALQECKAKLKEKQDKIELLEKRSQSERSAQKREERLLSATIYELGLGIMQSKLKSSSST